MSPMFKQKVGMTKIYAKGNPKTITTRRKKS